MTTRPPDDLHDELFDAAWKRASRDEPPAALDDAIRAAARREVGARPQHVSSVREATRPEPWWFPLAAAATIGAIAIGLLQITSPDRFASVDERRPVSDIPPGTNETNTPRMQAQAPSPPAAEAPSVAASKAPSAAPEQAASAPEGAAAKASSSASAPATPEVRRLAKQAPSSSAARTDAARDERSKRREPMAAAKPEDTAARQANAIAEPQPFPKAVDEVASAAAPAEPPASAAPPAPVASAASPAPQPAAAAASPLAESKSEAVKDQAKVAQSAPAAERTVREAAIEGQPTFKSRLAATTPSSADASSSAVDARAKMRASLPTDQWIALMRRLLVEQHYEELAKELAAFRSLHADANLLLPADLRDFRAPAPPR